MPEMEAEKEAIMLSIYSKTQDLPSQIKPPRDAGLDAARGWAVVLMFFCHAIRGIAWGDRPVWTLPVMAVEPWGQVLFLYLLGVSARLSGEACGSAWLRWRGQVRRIAGLALISALMVVLERGCWQSVTNLGSGFLALAGKCLLLLLLLEWVMGKSGVLDKVWVLTAGLLLWGGSAYFQQQAIWMNGLNAGNGPLLPLAAVAWAGFAGGRLRLRWMLPCAMGASLLGLALGYMDGSLDGGFFAWLDEAGRQSLPVALLDHGRSQEVYYYTLELGLALFWLGLSALLPALLRLCPRSLVAWLLPLGRHSLLAYLTHLAVLGAIRLGFGMLPGYALYALLPCLIGSMWGLCYGRDWYLLRKFLLLQGSRTRSSAG